MSTCQSSAITDRIAAEIADAGTTRRSLTAALESHGFDANDPVARRAVAKIQALRLTRKLRWIGFDPIVKSNQYRKFEAKRLHEARVRRAARDALLGIPMAAHWCVDRRAAIATTYDAECARRLAISATLEAVSRVSRQWGFVLRHTSHSCGMADSRYLVLPSVGEVRVSDHEIPISRARTYRYKRNGAPGWGEVVIVGEELNWSPTRWRRELMLRAAGRR